MVQQGYTELQINHLVSFKQDDSILAACREQGKSRLFLVFPGSSVYIHSAGNWELVEGPERAVILRSVEQAVLAGITVFHLNSRTAVAAGRFNS